MDNDAQILLDDVVAFCQRDGQDARLTNMLGQSTPISFDGMELTIEAPSRFAVAFLEKGRPVIEGYLAEIAFAPISLAVREPAGAAGAAARAAMAGGASSQNAPMAQAPAAAPAAQAVPVMPQATPIQQAAMAPQHIPAAAPAVATPTQAPGAPQPGFGMRPPIAASTAGAAGEVKISNTISRDQLAQIMGGGKAATGPGANGASAPVAAAPEESFPSVPVGSKFTFANFVYGDENKHAYHSAQRFAAFVEEPGQYNSLFIYGGSGLGKTHLLLAIKNYLAENKPHIRVKYANSQAYIDDFINEIARQKTEGRAILREYHDADVLIIDDIQQIVGKQASVEYFFSLMDEFIRESKKVVIASDRAPKKLGMDERLTSRFNAGMLCLVSEPGFEMKYTILKRYYESTIKGGADVSGVNVDASLLDAFSAGEGTLTDGQLRHMAEISGNNIRELESFCERCASLSYEREQQGVELSAADIERVADEYFVTAHKVIHIDTVQEVVEEFYHVSHEELIGPKRSKDIAFARHVAVYLSNSLCDLSSSAIGAEFGGRDHSTVLNSLKVVESKMKDDRRICEDLQQLKNRITLKS